MEAPGRTGMVRVDGSRVMDVTVTIALFYSNTYLMVQNYLMGIYLPKKFSLSILKNSL